MYDRGLSVLEQYGLESNAVYRTRGALVCETGQGRVLIKEFGGTPRKLECQALLLSDISGKSQVLTDEILPNLEGGYMSLDKENVPYIVKRWYEGRECDTRCEEDICTGAAALASLHKVMKMPVQEHYVRESLSQEYRRHNAELRKIRKFVSAKKKRMILNCSFWTVSSAFCSMERQPLTGWSPPDMRNCVSMLWGRVRSATGNIISITSGF